MSHENEKKPVGVDVLVNNTGTQVLRAGDEMNPAYQLASAVTSNCGRQVGSSQYLQSIAGVQATRGEVL
jgi:hypothetical protein